MNVVLDILKIFLTHRTVFFKNKCNLGRGERGGVGVFIFYQSLDFLFCLLNINIVCLEEPNVG